MDGAIDMNTSVISIAPLLWNNQSQRVLDSKITHGKGRKGVIIRTRRQSRLSCIKNAFSRGQK